MNRKILLNKIVNFFLTKIIFGIAIIGGLVFFTEWFGRLLLGNTGLSEDLKNVIIAIADACVALLSYILIFRIYEKRQIHELSLTGFGKNAIVGFITGFALQSAFIGVIYFTAVYSISSINPLSFLVTASAHAFTAGFVAEILLIGVFFRLIEEQLGTTFALIIMILLFIIAHVSVEGATFLSVSATAVQAGLMLSASYVFSRSLWLPVFLHFSWDFAEPGIYGGINPGLSIEKTLFSSNIGGPVYLTGGPFGPQNSIQAILFCLITSFIFLWLAKQKNNFFEPYWKM